MNSPTSLASRPAPTSGVSEITSTRTFLLLSLVSAAITLAPVHTIAQQNDEPTTLQLKAREVTLDVVVTDKQGPARGRSANSSAVA